MTKPLGLQCQEGWVLALPINREKTVQYEVELLNEGLSPCIHENQTVECKYIFNPICPNRATTQTQPGLPISIFYPTFLFGIQGSYAKPFP